MRRAGAPLIGSSPAEVGGERPVEDAARLSEASDGPGEELLLRTDAPQTGPQDHERRDAEERDVATRRQATKVTIAAAVCSFFGALYFEFGHVLFLGAATMALALVVYWIAEHHLGRPGGR